MKIALMQPYLFPYIGYLQLVSAVDVFVFYDDANYIRQGYINRNTILLEGAPHLFSWPVRNQSSFRSVRDHHVAVNGLKILRTVDQAYRRARYWAEARDRVARVLSTDAGASVADIAIESVCEAAMHAQLTTRFERSSALDYDRTASATTKILQICRQLGGAEYINSIGGRSLYNESDFLAGNMKLRFLRPTLRPYPQGADVFVPGLSVIDAMAHVSPQQLADELALGRLLSPAEAHSES